jgi:hypothetical protein
MVSSAFVFIQTQELSLIVEAAATVTPFRLLIVKYFEVSKQSRKSTTPAPKASAVSLLLGFMLKALN